MINLTINDVFIDNLMECKSREVLVYGGAGSGKSYAVAEQHILEIIASPVPIRKIYGRKILRSVRQSQFALFKEIIENAGLNDYFTINKSDMSFKFLPTGSELIAVGIDDPEKLKSIHDPVSFWIEEATELDYEDDQQIKLRLRKPGANLQIIYTFNPINKKHWIFKNYFVDSEGNERPIPMGELISYVNSVNVAGKSYSYETSILKTNYCHNHFVDNTFIASLESMKLNNYNYYQVYALAEWGELEDGLIFKRDYYIEYDHIPSDARGVAYCDPNLSKKGLGDTTAIFKMLYSSSMDIFYITDAYCESYSDSNKLLSDFINLRDEKCRYLGFDGNVSQESSWTQHVNNFCNINGVPNPILHYKRYKVDELSKNTQMLWNAGKIQFKKGFSKSKAGETILSQLYAFAGKKSNSKTKDDAPDSLICTTEFIVETGLAQLNLQNKELYQRLLNKR